MEKAARKGVIVKNSSVDLRKRYKKWMEGSFLFVLILITGLFFSFQRFDATLTLKAIVDKPIEVEVIPPTEQLRKPPKPETPKIPIESEDEDFPDDIPFEVENLFDHNAALTELAPPPEDEEPTVPFHEASEKPAVIKQIVPVYPELAKRAGIEGTVVLKVLVDTKGEVEDVMTLKTHPLLEASAIAAARQFKFTPGKQRDKLVKVWMSIPFSFTLK